MKGIELDAAVVAVKEMARSEYANGYGYQVIVEAMDDTDIAAEIEGCRSQKDAVSHMRAYAVRLTSDNEGRLAEVLA